jgi:hypothetical protein
MRIRRGRTPIVSMREVLVHTESREPSHARDRDYPPGFQGKPGPRGFRVNDPMYEE